MRLTIALLVALGYFCAIGANQAAVLPDVKVTGSATLATDYVYNGVSQTGGTGAWQADVTFADPTGLYVDVWASRVRFIDAPKFVAETDFTAGWTHKFGDWTIDSGADFVFFPPSEGPFILDNTEFLVSIKRPLHGTTVGAGIGFSPEFSNHSGRWWSGALDASVPIGAGISVTGHFGYQSTERPGAYGLPSYFNGLIGALYRVANVEFDLTESWTSIEKGRCNGRCAARLTAGVTLNY
jgi:uncharacterized protein (TIGR02001 family)